MAVQFTTEFDPQPTSPNVAYTRLGYILSSSNSLPPQYQFVLDVYESGSTQKISRLVQTPNILTDSIIYNTAVFDPSRIFQGELDFDNNWEVTGSVQPVNAVKTFTLKAGEQYGTSPSSSVTVYPDQDTIETKIFPGVINPVFETYTPGKNAWWFDKFYFIEGGNAFLTNCPSAQTIQQLPDGDEAYLLNSTDYFTVTSLKENLSTPGYIGINGVYVENGVQTFITQSFISAADGLGEFTTWGFGPQNLADMDAGWANYFASGSINALYTVNDPGGIVIYINDLWDGTHPSAGNIGLATAPLKQCSDEYTRFAFINRYGFWDYYNVYNPVRTTTALERQTYNEPQLTYYRNINQNRYNRLEPNESQYFLRSKDSYTIDTDFIDKQTADWLEELLESPEVFIQEGSEFVPIVLTNSSYEANNSTSRNKLFQYTIEWVYANPRRSKL